MAHVSGATFSAWLGGEEKLQKASKFLSTCITLDDTLALAVKSSQSQTKLSSQTECDFTCINQSILNNHSKSAGGGA